MPVYDFIVRMLDNLRILTVDRRDNSGTDLAQQFCVSIHVYDGCLANILEINNNRRFHGAKGLQFDGIRHLIVPTRLKLP